jgi:acetylornithine deacetylase/succinyl-diaminopimelate desuccinylase-like protein
LTKILVSIPSPSSEEEGIALFASDYLGDVELQNIKGFGPNVIARKTRDEGLPTILLCAHMDTVKSWKGGLNPRISGNRLYGLGAADMKAGLAILLHTFKNFNPKKVNLILALTVDEEGNSLGAYRLKKEKGLNADLCLIPEPTGERAMLGARGRFVLDIELKGEGGHGARPQKGLNVIDEATDVVRGLKKLKMGSHSEFGKGSYCVLKIWGGGDTLSIPSSCTVRVDRHIVPGESKGTVMKEFKAVIDGLSLKSKVKLRWMKRSTPFLKPYITRRTKLAKRFLTEHERLISGGTSYIKSVGDYNVFGKTIPTIVFGPEGKHWHTKREFVDIESTKRCAEFYSHFLREMGE